MNLYDFVRNDGLNFYDGFGLWKDKAHYEIIDEWLKQAQDEEGRSYSPYVWNCIKVPVGELLKKGNDEIDGTGHEGAMALLNAQGSSNAYMHAMRAPGQDAATARSLMLNFIKEEKQMADKAAERARNLIESDDPFDKVMAESYIKDAVRHIGRLQHPIADLTSPSHGGFQVWFGPGYAIMGGPLGEDVLVILWLQHAKGENEDVFKVMKSPVVTAVKNFSHPYLNEVLAE